MRHLLMTGVVAVLVVIVAAAVAGCGDDDKSDAPEQRTSAQPAAAEEFVAQADAICAVANKKEVALGAEGPGWYYSEQFSNVRYLVRFNAVGREALRKLRALTPPEEDRKTYDAALAAIERQVEALDAQIADLRAGRTSGRAANVREYDRGYTDLASAAAVLGLSQCQGLSV